MFAFSLTSIRLLVLRFLIVQFLVAAFGLAGLAVWYSMRGGSGHMAESATSVTESVEEPPPAPAFEEADACVCSIDAC